MEDKPLDVTVKYLEGIDWPANKDEVIAVAQRNGAPADVLEKLNAMEHDRFAGVNGVHNALWMKA